MQGESKKCLKFVGILYISFAIATISLVVSPTQGQENKKGEDDTSFNEIITWEAPYVLRKGFPYFLSGYDDEGCPVWVVEVGKWGIRHILESHEASFEDVQKYIRQSFSTMYQSGTWPPPEGLEKTGNGAEAEGEAGGLCETNEYSVIVDFEGFSNSQMTHPPSLNSFLNVARVLFELEGRGARLKTGFGINLNYFANSLYALVRPLLGSAAGKLKPLGTNRDRWRSELLRNFPKRSLPDWMGGYSNFTAVKVYG